MTIKKIILALFILLSASCEITDSDAGGPPFDETKDLIVDGEFSLEQTPEAILKEKFLKAVFSCSLWFQKGEELSLELEPSQFFTWDLINDYTIEKEFNLVEIIDSAARIDVTVNVLSFDVLTNLVNEGGELFKMTYNPKVSLGFSYRISEKISEIQTISNESKTKRNFSYNDSSIIIIDNRRALEGEIEQIFTYLKCDFAITKNSN